MKTENLIQNLAREVTPVEPVPPPMRMASFWILLCFPFLAGGVFLLGSRENIAGQIQTFVFWQHFLFSLSLSLTASVAAFTLGIPAKNRPWPYVSPLIAEAIGLLGFVYLISSAQESHVGSGINCFRNILLLSLAPALLFHFLAKKTLLLRPHWSAMWGILGAAALACTATRFICPNESSLHFLVWHFFPAICMGIFGFILSSTLNSASR